MVKKRRRFHVSDVIIYAILTVAALLCVLPVVHILALSFSAKIPAGSGLVSLWPVQPTTDAYKILLDTPAFWRSAAVTIRRLLLGVPLSMLFTILIAYPLSLETRDFSARPVFLIYFVITMFVSGGLIPGYLLVKELGLLNSIWALVLPGLGGLGNALLLLNFFRGLPRELSESVFIDGGGHFSVLFKIFLPISKPSLATILLFTILGHWNAWFDGIIYMDNPQNYPLQSYMQVMLSSVNFLTSMEVINPEHMKMLANISDKTVSSAQIFLGALPIILIYPFLQKYFAKGIIIGSVKG
jgi:putative aldouronate transport system permease protein